MLSMPPGASTYFAQAADTADGDGRNSTYAMSEILKGALGKVCL